jgi:hypothetical protein
MRTARFLLLIVYVAGHTGLPLPLPAGVHAVGVCGCGAACQCGPQNRTAGSGCCGAHAQKSEAAKPSCCAAKSEAVCTAEARTCCGRSQAVACCDEEAPQPPVLLPCGCQQDAPESIAACSDPRLLPEPIGPPRTRCSDWCASGGDPTAPVLVQSPDDPVPRLTA